MVVVYFWQRVWQISFKKLLTRNKDIACKGIKKAKYEKN